MANNLSPVQIRSVALPFEVQASPFGIGGLGRLGGRSGFGGLGANGFGASSSRPVYSASFGSRSSSGLFRPSYNQPSFSARPQYVQSGRLSGAYSRGRPAYAYNGGARASVAGSQGGFTGRPYGQMARAGTRPFPNSYPAARPGFAQGRPRGSMSQIDPKAAARGSMSRMDPYAYPRGSMSRMDPNAAARGSMSRMDPNAAARGSMSRMDPSAAANRVPMSRMDPKAAARGSMSRMDPAYPRGSMSRMDPNSNARGSMSVGASSGSTNEFNPAMIGPAQAGRPAGSSGFRSPPMQQMDPGLQNAGYNPAATAAQAGRPVNPSGLRSSPMQRMDPDLKNDGYDPAMGVAQVGGPSMSTAGPLMEAEPYHAAQQGPAQVGSVVY